MLRKATLPMSLIENEITKHVLILFTVNVAYSPSQRLQGQATMSEPPQHGDWQAFKVIDGNTNQTANGSSCAIIDFPKIYTSVWFSIHLRLFNVAYTEIDFRNEGSRFKKKTPYFYRTNSLSMRIGITKPYFYRTNRLSMRIGITRMLGLMKHIHKIILGF